jgi:GTP cyclohydrolase I
MTRDKIDQAADAYAIFMDQVIPGWREDPQAFDTPRRVAKSFVNDLVKSLHATEGPKISSFDNGEGYDGMVAQLDIPVKSLCAHHHLPIIGVAHVAYIPTPSSKIIGLSKLNRIVEFWSRRPQTQEHLTMQIHEDIARHTEGNVGVAVAIYAKHFCCSHRGISHDSTMKTAKLSGAFMDDRTKARDEFYQFISNLK